MITENMKARIKTTDDGVDLERRGCEIAKELLEIYYKRRTVDGADTPVWIARDTSGELFVYSSEPQRLDFPEEDGQPVGYFTSGGSMIRLNKDFYPEITYENSPVKCTLRIETI